MREEETGDLEEVMTGRGINNIQMERTRGKQK